MKKDRSALLTITALASLFGMGEGGAFAPINWQRPDWIYREYYDWNARTEKRSRSRPPFNRTQENARRVGQEAARQSKRAR